jgi:hypothetical protein
MIRTTALATLFVTTLSATAFAQSKPATPPTTTSGAQTAPDPAPAPSPATNAAPAGGGSTAASTDAVERARAYYERGLQLFNEENYDAALFEFERAYELAPSYKILYNMGRIQRQQNNYAAAIRSYERYLREGGANVPADRRTEVERELTILRPRVAEVTVKVNIDDADVYADDIPVCTATIESTCVGRSPLRAPIIVNSGRHKITASKTGWVTATSVISVVGSDKIEVKLDLVSLDRPVVKTNPWKIPAIIGWTVTGGALIAGGVTGVLALKAKDDQEAAVARFGATRQELDEAQDKTRTLGTVTDVLFIGAGAAALASTYLTFRAIGWKGGQESPSANVQVGLGRLGIGGSF